jgi:hypothetical protein
VRLRVLALVATAAAMSSAGAIAAAKPPLTAYLQQKGLVYALWVTAGVPLNSLQLILPAGNAYKLVNSRYCKLSSATTADCKAKALRRNQAFLVAKILADRKIPPSPPIFLTGESSNNSYEVKVPIKR